MWEGIENAVTLERKTDACNTGTTTTQKSPAEARLNRVHLTLRSSKIDCTYKRHKDTTIMGNDKEIKENLYGCVPVGAAMVLIILACLMLAFCSCEESPADNGKASVCVKSNVHSKIHFSVLTKYYDRKDTKKCLLARRAGGTDRSCDKVIYVLMTMQN